MELLQSRDLVQVHLTVPGLVLIHLTVPGLVLIHLTVPHQLVNHLLVLPLRHGCRTANIIHVSGQKYIQLSFLFLKRMSRLASFLCSHSMFVALPGYIEVFLKIYRVQYFMRSRFVFSMSILIR